MTSYLVGIPQDMKPWNIINTFSRRVTISGALTMPLSISMKMRFDRLYVSSTLNRFSPTAFTTV